MPARCNGRQSMFGSSTSPLPVSTSVCSVVANDQHGFQAAQHAVGAPVARQFDGGAHQMALVLFPSLASKRSCSVNASAVAPANPASTLSWYRRRILRAVPFDDDVAQRDLAIAAQRDMVAASYAHDGGGVKLFHSFLPFERFRWGGEADFKPAGSEKQKGYAFGA